VILEELEARHLLSATVAVNLSATSQTIRGMGGNFAKNARFAGAPLTDSVMNYELANLHPVMARVAINLSGWEPQPDNNNPNVINWAGFHDTGNQHQQFLQLQGFQKRGFTMMASIFDGPNWLVLDPQDKQHRTVDPTKYGFMAEGIGAWLIRLRDTYGVKIDRVSINESNAGFNLRFPASIFEAFLGVAGPMFQKMGLGYVKWVIGDDGFVSPKTFVTPVLSDTAISQYIGDIGWHTWNLDDFSDSAFTDLANVAKKYGKEIWATETGFDPLLFENDPAAFSTWDTAIKDAEIYVRSLNVLHTTVMDYWEDANDFPLVSPTNVPFPAFYIIQGYDNNLTPGTQMVQAKSNDGEILSMAAKNTAINRFFSQVINEDASKSESVTFTGLPNVPLTLTRSSATENAKVVGAFTPVGGKLTLTLPASSVSSLTGALAVKVAPKPPTAKISKPTSSTTYKAGGKISFSGSGTDPKDGNLSSSKLTWSIEFHHDGKVDAPKTFKGVSSGTFNVPSSIKSDKNQFYRITLMVIDSQGLIASTHVDLKPGK
jgi:O-glycosyl hydrolase